MMSQFVLPVLVNNEHILQVYLVQNARETFSVKMERSELILVGVNISVSRLGDLLNFGQLFKAFGNI